MSDPAPGRKLRVVFIDHVARLSGGEIALLRVLPVLALSIEPHVIFGEEGPLVGQVRALGISAEVMPLAPRLRELRKEALRPGRLDALAFASLPSYVFRLSGRIRALDTDLVHTNSLKASLYGGAAARLAKTPVVWHLRDRIAPDYLPRGAVALVRATSRIVPAAIVANSRSTLETLPGSVRRRRPSRSVVVPDAVEPRPPRSASSRTTTTVGVIGRLAPWKGQNVFLDAFAEAFAGTQVRGHVIGSAMFGEDAYASSLEQQAERLGIAAQIEFRGFREDVWAELAELDILVHCSLSPEPFGQVVLEGMAAGVPVIAAAAGGPAELIRSGLDGLLTAPGDVDGLVSAMRALWSDPDLRARIAHAALERSRDFTPDQTAEQLLAVYRGIMVRR